jgi:hypothetical protein
MKCWTLGSDLKVSAVGSIILYSFIELKSLIV